MRRARGRSGRGALTKGPWEHGVKYRSNCKVCSACPHGRRCSQCRSAVGLKSASTVVYALHARSAAGLKSASTVVRLSLQGVRRGSICEHGRGTQCKERPRLQHGRQRYRCKSAVGLNLRPRSSALSVQGVRWGSFCEHGRQRPICKECGSGICSTVVDAMGAGRCGGGGICEHGRQRSKAKCGGGSVCEHGRLRYRCKECHR